MLHIIIGAVGLNAYFLSAIQELIEWKRKRGTEMDHQGLNLLTYSEQNSAGMNSNLPELRQQHNVENGLSENSAAIRNSFRNTLSIVPSHAPDRPVPQSRPSKSFRGVLNTNQYLTVPSPLGNAATLTPSEPASPDDENYILDLLFRQSFRNSVRMPIRKQIPAVESLIPINEERSASNNVPQPQQQNVSGQLPALRHSQCTCQLQQAQNQSQQELLDASLNPRTSEISNNALAAVPIVVESNSDDSTQHLSVLVPPQVIVTPPADTSVILTVPTSIVPISASNNNNNYISSNNNNSSVMNNNINSASVATITENLPETRNTAAPPASTEQQTNTDGNPTETSLPLEDSSSAPPRSEEEIYAEREEQRRKKAGYWPHAPCSLFACISCTLGMYSICRFSYLSLQYGGGFILQFLMLTVIFGLPMVSFQMSAGQYLGTGIMDMWKISPLFRGVGIASLIASAMIGIYSIVPVSWMFVYFRDAFITNITFKWGDCRTLLHVDDCLKNGSEVFRKSVPAYFYSRVLQRPLAQTDSSTELVFENVFNLAVIWMIVFISLSKGIKSYGKVVLAFGIFPIVSFYLVSIELLRRAGAGAGLMMTLSTDFNSFFFNSWSWMAAAREVFFIWGINGAVLMQMTSRNKLKYDIKRDCAILIVVTLSVVLISGFLSCACLYLIYSTESQNRSYFTPSSYEELKDMQFMMPQHNVLTKDLSSYQSVNYYVGVETTSAYTNTRHVSGYQVSRLATELYPMAVVSLGPDQISAFWPVLFYLCLITFGIAQQLAIWKCVVECIIAIKPEKLKPWETSITFVACVFGFVLSLPFTTRVGIFVVHFVDVCVGSAWWIMIIYLLQAFALFLVRGRPYSSDEIISVFVNSPMMKKWLFPIMTFSWNIVLPVTLLVLAITSFKLGDFGKIYDWSDSDENFKYWPVWAKQFGALMQLMPIVIIPIVCIVQLFRYISKGNETLSVRLQRLYRPSLHTATTNRQSAARTIEPGGPQEDLAVERDDPPPKYTPPPSYSTATGLKALKRLNSIRTSIRRLAIDVSSRASLRRNREVGLTQETSSSRSSTSNLSFVGTASTSLTSVAADSSSTGTAELPPTYASVIETNEMRQHSG